MGRAQQILDCHQAACKSEVFFSTEHNLAWFGRDGKLMAGRLALMVGESLYYTYCGRVKLTAFERACHGGGPTFEDTYYREHGDQETAPAFYTTLATQVLWPKVHRASVDVSQLQQLSASGRSSPLERPSTKNRARFKDILVLYTSEIDTSCSRKSVNRSAH